MTKCPTCWKENPAEINTCTPWLYKVYWIDPSFYWDDKTCKIEWHYKNGILIIDKIDYE